VNRDRRWGPIDFGPDAIIDLDGIQRRWFDRWLKGTANGIDTEPPVRIFVMGANEWRSEGEWPLARTQYVEYYIHSGGAANTRFGDGTLSREPPGEEPPDRFRYDPADPAPFSTGFGYAQVGGPDDYREVERRQDVLVYTGPTLTEDLEVCGPLSVTLYASSSARDTDWTARILGVHPDGYAQRLNDGIVRARFRNGLEREELLTPGRVEEYTIDAWATCARLGPGHRLRLEISSSSWPQFDRNLNTGGPLWKEAEWAVADQTVFHDRARPSHMLIPVIPPGGSTGSGVLDRGKPRLH
jgi:putative CocE/NonD family hydrolase